jgi:peptidoglycan/LPS O-acetylase OafA/YrhL
VKSSTGEHFVGLDHVRAIAAFMVFCWHFLHEARGYPVPFEGAPAVFPLALLDEGNIGVSLFMSLSGFLFAKLLDGRSISYPAFLWNRFVRLAPLLVVVLVLAGIWQVASGAKMPYAYITGVVEGFIQPTWPNGGWSIAVELHFYLVLPILLWTTRRVRFAPLLVVIAAVVLRAMIYRSMHEIQFLAYWTIIGRIDQFCFGILAYSYRAGFKGAHRSALAALVAFFGLVWVYDALGGVYQMGAQHPALSVLWIIIPTVEGAFFAFFIAYYDNNFAPTNRGVSAFASRIGAYSYSIYLLHFFLVFRMSRFVHEHIMNISNFYLALSWACVGFLLMIPIGALSYNALEKQFLRFRTRYVR